MLIFLGNKFLRGLAVVDEPISGFFKLQKIRTGKNFGFRGILASCFFVSFIYNGQMLGENKNLKDIHQDSKTNLGISVTDNSFSISYTKTHKLITALYMVTDVIDKEEPIRAKLRVLGTGIISDMHSDIMPVPKTLNLALIGSSLSITSVTIYRAVISLWVFV